MGQELTGNLSAEAAGKTGRLTPDPLMGFAGGLPIPEDFLGVPSIQIYKAVSHKDGRKTDQERNQTHINPSQAHQILQ